MKAPSFWYAPPGWLSNLLSPLGWLYGKGAALLRKFYRPHLFPIPIISIGNITSGGAGKTPTAMAIADLLKAEGHRVHFVTRGYKGTLKGPLQVDLRFHTAKDVGDEALLLAHHAPTWVGKKKRAALEKAIEKGAHIVILDDGHQTKGIFKDLSFVVVDSLQGFGNHRVIPAGPLREPLKAGLSRADALIHIGKGSFKSALPVFKAHLSPHPLPFKNHPCVAFCGLGFPEKFYQSLKERGAEIVATHSFPDHYFYTQKDLRALHALAEKKRAVLVTTRKDWIRLPPPWQKKVSVLDVDLQFEAPGAFYQLMAERLFS